MTLLKGALVSFTPTFLVPMPNVTVFQYNPENLTHTWTQPDGRRPTARRAGSRQPAGGAGHAGRGVLADGHVDSNQDIADGAPVSAQLAQVSGVYTRLPRWRCCSTRSTGRRESRLLGQASAALGPGRASAASRPSPSSVPVVLFVWGPLRIVPVRVTGLTITEKLYDALLNPIHAEAQLALRVLTPAELKAAAADNDVLAKLATVAYTYTLGIRQVGALANLGNAAGPIAEICSREHREMSTPASRYLNASTYQAVLARWRHGNRAVIPAPRSPAPIGFHPRAVGDRSTCSRCST